MSCLDDLIISFNHIFSAPKKFEPQKRKKKKKALSQKVLQGLMQKHIDILMDKKKALKY